MRFLTHFWCTIQRYQRFPYLPTLILGYFLGSFRTCFASFSAADDATTLLNSWLVIYAWQWNAGNKNRDFIKHGNSKYHYLPPYKSCVRDFLVLFWGSVREKMTVSENVSFIDNPSAIRFPDGCKFVVNQENVNDVTICGHEVTFKFCLHWYVSLVKFSYWSKFNINIATGSGVMIIFVYKGLTRNPEIGKNLVSFPEYLETRASLAMSLIKFECL